MLGFEDNDTDPQEYVTAQVDKVRLRKSRGLIHPIIESANS